MRLRGGRVVPAALAILATAVSPALAFNGLTSPDGRYVMAVGDLGAAHRSWNAGVQWSSVGFDGADFHDVAMRGFTVLVVGENGAIRRSADYGGLWTQELAPGSPDLRAVAIPSDTVAVAVGPGGAILRSTDGGAGWGVVASGVTADLEGVAFADALTGWAVGESLTVLATLDGGATWTPASVGGPDDLVAASTAGGSLWAVGRAGTILRAPGGGPLQQSAFALPPGVGLEAVAAISADVAVLAGGGGFVCRTEDGGATWQHGIQPALDPIADLAFSGADSGWACTRGSHVVLRTLDGGLTWQIPPGTQDFSEWFEVLGTGGPIRGATISANGQNLPNGVFGAVANSFYRSGDYGDTWSLVRTMNGVSKINAFIVSPKDSNVMVAAVDLPDRIIRTTTSGAVWTDVLARDFSEYGPPIEMNPDKPDTLLFAPEDGRLYISTDFGATWDTLSNVPFRSPCDIVIVPGDDSRVWVGDGVTGEGFGQIYTSTDGGLTFTLSFTSDKGSEIPALTAAAGTDVGLATQWSNGGVLKTIDGGASWSVVSNVEPSWGASFAPDDPNVVAFGLFGGQATYFSSNQGADFTRYPIPSANYSLYARDRASYLATQTFGIFKFRPRYQTGLVNSQSMTLASPVGGNILVAGSSHTIRWNASGVYLAQIEYQTEPTGPWLPLATVPGYLDEYAWSVPYVPANGASLRIRDAWDHSPSATSGTFTIAAPGFLVQPAPAVLGPITVGVQAGTILTLENTGNTDLHVASITTGQPEFWTGRTTLTIASGASDTLGLYYFSPVSAVDTALVMFDTNASPTPLGLQAFATAVPAQFALEQNRPNPFRGLTEIRYALPTAAHVALEVFNLQGQRVATLVDGPQPAGEYRVPFGPDLGSQILPAGVYFCRFRAGASDLRKKMVLLR
jgi:photosystem II stability/assembly factor-like uncharacterized protein